MTNTRGNIIIEKIKVGDIHYEYGFGNKSFVKVKVLTPPMQNERGAWVWKALNIDSQEPVEYFVAKNGEAYAPKLYSSPPPPIKLKR